jgi:hypothetical protein
MAGTPKRQTQLAMRESTMTSVSMLVRKMASSHLLVQSMMVKRDRNPSLDVSSSPMKSTWMCEKCWVGTGMGCCSAAGWRTTLAQLLSGSLH